LASAAQPLGVIFDIVDAKVGPLVVHLLGQRAHTKISVPVEELNNTGARRHPPLSPGSSLSSPFTPIVLEEEKESSRDEKSNRDGIKKEWIRRKF
jgi:hypothetical protein